MNPASASVSAPPLLTDQEVAAFRRSRRLRWVRAVLLVTALFVLAAAIGLPVSRHLRATAGFQMIGADVRWQLDEATWRRGGATSLSALGDHAVVTDASLKLLVDLHNLESLSLVDCEHVTDSGLSVLKDLHSLKELDLSRGTLRWRLYSDAPPPKLTDAALVPLRNLTRLTSLSLAGNAITDDGLALLSTLTNLESLDLRETQVTDKGIPHLKKLKRLKTLFLNKTKVTKEAIMELDQALGGIEIDTKEYLDTDAMAEGGEPEDE